MWNNIFVGALNDIMLYYYSFLQGAYRLKIISAHSKIGYSRNVVRRVMR